MASKINLEKGSIQVDVLVFKEGKYQIAYVPALNLTSYSTTQKAAVSQLDDAVKLFFDYWVKSKKLHEKLIELGWKKMQEDHKDKFLPSNENINVPYPLIGKIVSKKSMSVPAYC
jgi:hypothetical protein